MKFGISNEGKDLAIEVLEGRKTVTRRDRKYKVGEIVEIEKIHYYPSGHEYSVLGKARVKSCKAHGDFSADIYLEREEFEKRLEEEANREGYRRWDNLIDDLTKFYPTPSISRLWRIELEVIKED